MLDYPGHDGQSEGYLANSPVASRRGSGQHRFDGGPSSGRPFGGRLFISRRVVAVGVPATLAFVTAAAIIGSFVLFGSHGTNAGGSNATSGVPLPALATPPAIPSASPSTHVTARPHRSRKPTASATVPGAGSAPGTTPVPRSAPPTSHMAASHKPAIAVRYLVDGQWPNGFRGQVIITNNTTMPITGWQAVLALYGDVVTSVQNATGLFSNSILLLQPATDGADVPPHGGTLTVSFVAEGFRTVPVTCAFDGVSCG